MLHPGRMADGFSAGFFASKFPDDAPETIPRYFANACCSQFAVSKGAIHSRPLADYRRLYEWIRDDPFVSLTGRMMEYLWPFVFDKRGSGCEDVVSCYCENYGVCFDDGDGDGDNDGESSVKKTLLRGWIDGYRRAEEVGDEAGMLVRQAIKHELVVLKTSREHSEQKEKIQGKAKSKAEIEKTKLRLAEEEEGVRKAATKQIMATEQYRKLKDNQREVWQLARQCRRRLAEMLGLGNDAGEQSLRLD